MIEIRNIKLPVEAGINELEKQITKRLRLKAVPRYEILKRSIDARKKPDIFYIFQVGVYLDNDTLESRIVKKIKNNDIMLTDRAAYELPCFSNVINVDHNNYGKESESYPDDHHNNSMLHHPVVVGAGPAGLFCAFILAKCGYAPIIVERGSRVEERVKKVDDFWKGGKLDTECNVQFGEGGAGTFSDGKLNTQVKDKLGRIRFVLEEFVKHGADREILYDNKPHIGSDVLINVVSGMRKEIEELGGTFLFDTRVTDFEFENIKPGNSMDSDNSYLSNRANDDECLTGNLISNRYKKITRICLTRGGEDTWVETNHVVLAIGHSARDTFAKLYDKDVSMVSKDFAMGVRIEHPESLIRKAMYGDGPGAKKLPTPPYKLTYQTKAGRGVYSFCMCPGGYVVNASSEEGCTAVNGMSYSGRNGENSNSALIVTVRREDYGSELPLAGIELQRKLERAVYEQGNGKVVVQRYEDFKEGRPTEAIGSIMPQTKGEYICGNVAACLPDYIRDSIVEAMPSFDKDIEGFAGYDVIMSGVESRTSSPVRILRGKDYQSENIMGLYPCGEGAGYAGGIMSAAMDGMKVAEAIVKGYMPKQ
ncbi:MAG: FAD-dependent oxidoreductase [Lachnospiraceae bacterium]|nr:FAD-dependent oxidoreductase [Lachnospiraceae bacterium]